MSRLWVASSIISDVAVEVGLTGNSEPVTSSVEEYVQLTNLLNTCGQELIELHEWQILKKEHEIVTSISDDPAIYTLPTDFSYMIDQTQWERTNRNPMAGPLSSQQWTYLAGRNLVSSTIYANFRMIDNRLELYPSPPPDGLEINFEYISRNWVRESNGTVYKDKVSANDDTVLYEPILIKKFLKAKFLESKGFDASAARLEFDTMLGSRTGRDTGGRILSASRRMGYPYLSPYRNTADTWPDLVP